MPLFNGGYDVRHSVFQHPSALGRLGQHADWRVDRILSVARRATDDQAVMWNAVLVGALVFGLAQLAYVSLHRWQAIGEIACGLWLMASPFTFGYAEAGALRYWHFALGAIV